MQKCLIFFNTIRYTSHLLTTKKSLLFSFLLIITLPLTSCTTPKVPFSPKNLHEPCPLDILKKPSPFAPLDQVEKTQDFAKEYVIGLFFAHEADFYRAITAFKRALILLENSSHARYTEIEYYIILSYYLGKKYDEALSSFDQSTLRGHLSQAFPAFSDLLVILYDSASKVEDKCYAQKVLQKISLLYPQLGLKLETYQLIAQGDMDKVISKPSTPVVFTSLFRNYSLEKKSIKRAEMLNTFLPGAGYLYVGQKSTAFTALVVNTLFIYASYQFFQRGYIPLGIIMASLEGGWWVGGIYGAGRAAAQFNEVKYEQYSRKGLDQTCLYPILQLNFLF